MGSTRPPRLSTARPLPPTLQLRPATPPPPPATLLLLHSMTAMRRKRRKRVSRRERRSKLIILIENDHKMNMETILSLFNLVDTQNAFSVSLIIWNVEASESFV